MTNVQSAKTFKVNWTPKGSDGFEADIRSYNFKKALIFCRVCVKS